MTSQEELQAKVDKVKAISFLNNAHNLTPPNQSKQDDKNEIAIINALKVDNRLKTLFLEARGQIFDEDTKEIRQISKPYMNVDGAWRLVQVCKKIAEEAEWSNFEADNIPAYVEHFYRENLPYFTFWHEDYGLEKKDFNFVMTTLKMFILASFYKGKNAKYLNTLRGVYSEDFLGKALKTDDNKKRESFLEKLNPLRKVD